MERSEEVRQVERVNTLSYRILTAKYIWKDIYKVYRLYLIIAGASSSSQFLQGMFSPRSLN